MSIIEVILTGIGLAADASSVAITKGLKEKNSNIKNSIIVASYFGIFQTIMPIIGYFIANSFYNKIINISHYIAFFLLSIIAVNMIIESIGKEKNIDNDKIDIKTMIPLAIATSIDALVVGLTFSMLDVNIITSSLIIGIITFILSFIGFKIGNKIGNKLKDKSGLLGGIILIIIAIKILVN